MPCEAPAHAPRRNQEWAEPHLPLVDSGWPGAGAADECDAMRASAHDLDANNRMPCAGCLVRKAMPDGIKNKSPWHMTHACNKTADASTQ